MARNYNTLKAAILAGETVRLRDGRLISRVEDLPRAETSDLRGRPMSQDEAGKVLDENERLKRENERLKAGFIREGGPGVPVSPMEQEVGLDSVKPPLAAPGIGGTVTKIETPVPASLPAVQAHPEPAVSKKK